MGDGGVQGFWGKDFFQGQVTKILAVPEEKKEGSQNSIFPNWSFEN